MSSAAVPPAHPLRVFDAVVNRVQDISAHFRRITFAGAALDRFGVPGPALDLRIKLLLPVPGHQLARPGAPDGQLHEGWYQDWLRVEQPGRGWIRSYTVGALRTTAQGRELDVDFVIHPDDADSGAPGSNWARAAAPGTTAVIIGPDDKAITGATPQSETGIRWNPQGVRHVLLAGDETAVPAISSILETLPGNVSGHAFLEVQDSSDFREIGTGSAVRITWLARTPSDAPRGHLLYAAVRAAIPASRPTDSGCKETCERHAAPGRAVPPGIPAGRPDGAVMYAWIAAEAATVKNLRRYLVNQVGLDPKHSEFRGYWSRGKAGSGTNGTPIKQEPRPQHPGATTG
ncbi:iron complex transport system ATP-binding protein [Arthrobacter sp. V4I6]|uniref:siderophore-interacting protein n=1 Tax=unclassified Arthrobacter TaxID=235627 RepID=UPI002785D2D2|nr:MULTISPECIES: siderophore-interacting protein [unclassified Arthrobacter]MDQ0820956.1 iron complex transport system ATP-binding protein [Arthrobacter sp. V1I7]MDQ0855217.1 iron complex transport system ATP-binding protein [Arthrobacter sp. V4I6]